MANNQKSFTRRFLDFLGGRETSIPKGAQWFVTIEEPESIFDAIESATSSPFSGVTNLGDLWNISPAEPSLNHVKILDYEMCMFCQAIGIPGDSMVANPEGINSNGLIRSYVGQGRNAFPSMRMSFLETNVSFAENFLRGWAVATATFGLIARPKNTPENYRTNICCYKLSNQKVLTKWTFFDACCISVSEEEYNYNPATAPILREAQFIYNSYRVDTSELTNLRDINSENYGNLNSAVNNN